MSCFAVYFLDACNRDECLLFKNATASFTLTQNMSGWGVGKRKLLLDVIFFRLSVAYSNLRD